MIFKYAGFNSLLVGKAKYAFDMNAGIATSSLFKKTVTVVFFLLLISISSATPSFAVDSGPTFKTVSSGEHFTCGLTTTGDVYCWGAKDQSQLGTSVVGEFSTPNKVYQISDALEIAAGRDFACARLADGGIVCWGRGDLGQTGDGIDTKIDRIFATRVHSVSTAVGITAGASHACVLLRDKTVKCWGENQLYQLGNEVSKNETMPVLVEGVSEIKQISSGANHTCALSEAGFVHCWGDNKFGQLGIGTMQTLKAKSAVVLGVKKVMSIQLGYNTSCASMEKTGFTCWGWGIDGQLAETDRFNRSLPVPMTLSTLTESATALVSVSMGRTKACGLMNTAKSNLMYCWGTTATTDPVSGSAASSVSLGSDHGCLVTTTGTVQCWGWNHQGQLGRGIQSNSLSTIATVSGFPDWTYWINTWSINYEDNLGLLSWTGGAGKYLVTIEGKGIVCETLLGVKSCKFGPLESNKTYTGTIFAQNTPLSNSRTANISFTTGNLTSALDQYTINLATATKEKLDLVKAEAFLTSLSKQIDLALKVEAVAVSSFVRDIVVFNKYIETLNASDVSIAKTTIEIRKMITTLQSVAKRVIKKIGN